MYASPAITPAAASAAAGAAASAAAPVAAVRLATAVAAGAAARLLDEPSGLSVAYHAKFNLLQFQGTGRLL